MDAGRWRRIEQLFHDAQPMPAAERAAFLRDQCADDPQLLQEVDSFLRMASAPGGVLALGALDAAAIFMRDAPPSLVGRQLGPFRVDAVLGAGGMGEVYRARDTKLGRDVAIKVLPPRFTVDRDRLARFEREARMLATLNHPHIGAIYGFEDDGNVHALVLELVDGQTLAEKLASGSRGRGLPTKEAVKIAAQIAQALDAAHEKGIVHRDLKPANIKIAADGSVKVLDFGLAKAMDPTGAESIRADSSPTVTIGGTQEGLILGTAAYMSPEQARGKPVDKRTDIWAFGCVLYEMLTGTAAFSGETISDTIAAILEREPDWGALPEPTPVSLRRLLSRCLEKDLVRRLRDIGDARVELEDSVIGGDTPVRSASVGKWRTTAIASAVVALLAVALVVWTFTRPVRSSIATPSATARTIASRLTDYGGNERSPALSPDGRSFVFVSDHGGTPDIWLRQVVGGEPVRLTNDAAVESDLAFMPDGESLLFTRSADGAEAIWQTGILGGSARKIIADAFAGSPSPDGRSVAFFTRDPDGTTATLHVSTIAGSNVRTLARQVPSFPAVRPSWSPDGRFISYVRAGLFAPANLFVVEVATGVERRVTQFVRPPEGIARHSWLPDNRHLAVAFTSYSRTQAKQDLGVLDVTDGSISRVTTTISDSFSDPTVSHDGSRLLATTTDYFREVWKIPAPGDASKSNLQATRVIDNVQEPLWTYVSRDGRLLLFNGTLSGSRNLWVQDITDTAKPRQITALAGDLVAHSSLSPDASRVAFVSFAGGASDIWVQDVDGSNTRELTNDPAPDSWPVWSPDMQTIVFSSIRNGVQETWMVPAAGGPSRKYMDGFFRGDWIRKPTGDGTWIVTNNGLNRIRLIDVERHEVIWDKAFPGGGNAMPMFSADGRSISLVVQETRDHDAVLVLDSATGASRLAAHLPFRTVFRACWLDNEKAFLVNRQDPIAHIVLFDRFWEPPR